MFRISVTIFIVLITVTTSSYAKIQPDTIRGLWLLDDGKGQKATDSSRNKLHGTLIGTPKWVNANIGQGLRLSGDGDTVEIPGFAEEFPREEVTITVWVKVEGPKNRDLFSFEPFGPGHVTVHMPWDDGIQWHFGTPFVEMFVGFNKQVKDVWRHWAFVHSLANNVMLVYHDGDEVGRIAMSQAYTPRAGSFYIGGRPGFSFHGIIDEVGIFESMLSQDDIRDVMENGLSVPASAVSPVIKLAVAWGQIKQPN